VFPTTSGFSANFLSCIERRICQKIARDWNTKDAASGYVGYVTKFSVQSEYLSRFQVQTVGSADLHLEYWIPAEQLEEFNQNIIGKILIISEFRGHAP
jgi:hypothetical protein